MANPGDQVPYGADFLIRRINDLERKVMEGFAARSLAASQIGNGGTLLIDGSLQVTGSITVPGVLASAGALSAGTTVTAGSKVIAGTGVDANGPITGSSLNVGSGAISGGAISGGTLSAGGASTLVGQITSTGSRATLSGSWNALYVSNLGVFGIPPSSERFKQDVTPAMITVEAINALELVHFRYIADVEECGDAAPVQLGLIAERVEEHIGPDFVFYDEDGLVAGIHFERLAFALLPAVQEESRRLTAIEARLTTAGI